ncbi:MAG: hypothetical protein ACHQAY_24315, partial [Hyphomicrobiales bacterium]
MPQIEGRNLGKRNKATKVARSGWFAIWALLAFCCTDTGSSAQPAATPDQAQLRAEADLLFKRMLVKPNDLDATFRFSEIETKLGDYEAAIGA